MRTQYRRQQLKIPRKIQSSSATEVCAGGMAFGGFRERWGGQGCKASHFSISNQAFLSATGVRARGMEQWGVNSALAIRLSFLESRNKTEQFSS